MQNLLLKQLTLASDIDKSANRFEFSSRFNLITAEDNSVGKSTLVKLLMWTFGCEPTFDYTWKALDCKAIVDFEIAAVPYRVARHGSMMFLAERGQPFTRFSKITGEYSKAFSDIVGFDVRLPNKKNPNALEIPPPAYYFLPFYLDQRRSWSKLWDGFENLQQYGAWQSTVIKYHTGYVDGQFFDFEDSIAVNRQEKAVISDEVKKIDAAIEVVNTYVPASAFLDASTSDELRELTISVEGELTKLKKDQEYLLGRHADLFVDRQYYESQLKLITEAASELELDYIFSVERIDGEELQCPLCGVMHDSSLAKRADILVDKESAVAQSQDLQKQINRVEGEINKISLELDEISARLDDLNRKHIKEGIDSDEKPLLIDSLAARSVEKIVRKSKEDKIIVAVNIDKKNRTLRKEQKALLSSEKKEELDSYFVGAISSFVEKLNATGVNMSNVHSALDYKKMLGGGAAEATRGALAYNLAALKQIYYVKNEVTAPFIVDTPNQQEQTFINYDRIIKMLMEETPRHAQIFLCAMESPQLTPYRKDAKVIILDEGKVLDKNKYSEIRGEFSFS